MIPITEVRIEKHVQGRVLPAQDAVAVEEPLGLHLRYGPPGAVITKAVSVTMRTPGADAALAAGFLFTEGILSRATDVAAIAEGALGENTVLVTLAEGIQPVLGSAERNFYTTSSCGVCGKTSIDAIVTVSPYPAVDDTLTIDATTLCSLPQCLREQQAVFQSTGGLHASALFTPDGTFLTLQEDVGRHNALDKVIGDAFLRDSLPLADVVLLLSGRASFELVQKAVMAGIRMVAAIGAPSSLAVQTAEAHGVTLVGFLREGRFNVYTHSRRIRSKACSTHENPD